MHCEFCKRDDAATTDRGLARHRTICKSNPKNVVNQESIEDRVRIRADGHLASAERLVRELNDDLNKDIESSGKAAHAVAAFDRYRECVALLGLA